MTAQKIINSATLVILTCANLLCQEVFYNGKQVDWEDFKPVEIPSDYSKYKNNLVVIDDKAEFMFYKNNHRVLKLITFYIVNEAGLNEFKNIKLPESFDLAFNANFHKQGRAARIKIPFMTSYQVQKFSARKRNNNKWEALQHNHKYEKVRWIMPDGRFGDEDVISFQLLDLKVGDIVQVYYEAAFEGNYGGNLFYFYSSYPKLNVEYIFNYSIESHFSEYNMFLPLNIPDSCIARKKTTDKTYAYIAHKIKLKNVGPINYPANSFQAQVLPHVYIDAWNLPAEMEFFPNGLERTREDMRIKVRVKDFNWIFNEDTTNEFVRIFDRSSATIRKFIASLPSAKGDSGNVVFFKALCDTFNAFNYLTQNHLFYNQSHLYELSNVDHLTKRRLIGSSTKLCTYILNEKEILYYRTNLQDKRYGMHTLKHRVNFPYEWEIFSIPVKNSFIYFLPRINGVKYHLNELPFYMEGAVASLYPTNFHRDDTSKASKFFKFIVTHKSTYNENTRTENATIKVNLDEKLAEYAGKESLSGQFSTVLRHLYLNECIDSTLSPHYFKKCTDKPNASEVRTRLSSKTTEFPFRYTFTCTEKIKAINLTSLNTSGWFSFLIDSKFFSSTPTHNFYFDFDFSDIYNFMLEFNKPVQIKNAEDFRKKINNDFFELESEMIKNTDTSYLWKVKLVAKQRMIPLKDMQLLMDLVKELDALNRLALEF